MADLYRSPGCGERNGSFLCTTHSKCDGLTIHIATTQKRVCTMWDNTDRSLLFEEGQAEIKTIGLAMDIWRSNFTDLPTEEEVQSTIASLRQMKADLTPEPLCWSRGPRIGNDGCPYCKEPKGHSGAHRPAESDGWGVVTWTDPW